MQEQKKVVSTSGWYPACRYDRYATRWSDGKMSYLTLGRRKQSESTGQ